MEEDWAYRGDDMERGWKQRITVWTRSRTRGQSPETKVREDKIKFKKVPKWCPSGQCVPSLTEGMLWEAGPGLREPGAPWGRTPGAPRAPVLAATPACKGREAEKWSRGKEQVREGVNINPTEDKTESVRGGKIQKEVKKETLKQTKWVLLKIFIFG